MKWGHMWWSKYHLFCPAENDWLANEDEQFLIVERHWLCIKTGPAVLNKTLSDALVGRAVCENNTVTFIVSISALKTVLEALELYTVSQ